jgi:hypothetical protein
MSVRELQRQIAHALDAGADLDTIEETIIETAPVGEEQRAALALRRGVPRTPPRSDRLHAHAHLTLRRGAAPL